MARTTFSGPVRSLNGFEGDVIPSGPVALPSISRSELPNAEDHAGALVFVSDEQIVAFSDGSGWVDLGNSGG